MGFNDMRNAAAVRNYLRVDHITDVIVEFLRIDMRESAVVAATESDTEFRDCMLLIDCIAHHV